jgi:hypothetical protein
VCRYSGYTTITHPFHPLKGKSFQILSTKNFNNKDILSLKTLAPRSVISVPRDWTDKADPNPYEAFTDLLPILSFSHLQQLAQLIADLNQAISKKRD